MASLTSALTHARTNALITPPSEKTREPQEGDPNRRLSRLAAKTPKTGEFYFGAFGEFYFGIDTVQMDSQPGAADRRTPKGVSND